jgi:phosphatidylglycerol:prolipoprotein diacylglycerol transferase
MAYPKGVVPTTIPVHPTPVYEILMMIPIVWILWRLRTIPGRPGWHFGFYLALVGAERFIAEFYRVRLEKTLGLSMAQWISVAVVLAGMVLISSRRSTTPADA